MSSATGRSGLWLQILKYSLAAAKQVPLDFQFMAGGMENGGCPVNGIPG